MANKKILMKSISSILAATVTITGFNGMPAITFAEETENSTTIQADGKEQGVISEITDFKSNIGTGKIHINETDKSATLDKTDGDHFAVYNGLEKKTNDFILEADVDLLDSGNSAALTFGIDNKDNPGSKWYGANIDTNNTNTFRIFGPGYENGIGTIDIDTSKALHLKIDVKADGSYIYSFGNKNGDTKSIEGIIPGWQGGYIGILTFKTSAKFYNISFENRQKDTAMVDISTDGAYKTNLTGITAMDNAEWQVTDEGLYSNATGKGDSFLYSQTEGTDFVYSTDVTFKDDNGAASLVFRSNNDAGQKECYVVNLDAGTMKCKFWKWQTDGEYQLIPKIDNVKEISRSEDNTYNLKVVAVDSWISYYVNDELIASTGDYTLQDFDQDRGQSSCYYNGYLGLLNWNGNMVFQNTYYKEIGSEFTPVLKDINVTSSDSSLSKDIEAKPQFFQNEPTRIQYVKNSIENVNIDVTPENDSTDITIYGADGTKYTYGKNIPLEEGANYITVESSITENINDNYSTAAKLVYRVNVHRRQPDIIYYNEPYRSQYHYSVKDGWGNDPNGLVYCDGVWHFYYQFYDDIAWGPMHQAHATSTDLIHWEEKPVSLFPDANGTIFNGCIVIDKENTSGLFDNSVKEENRWVNLITNNGNGQRIKVAYSTDQGETWIKSKDIAADWKDDPLKNRDFRDPKVFRWENKWFMVIAGGPLRIYSSDNLLNWKCESAYKDLHTECPDLYPVKADDGKIKWVLSRGGRHYKIGDFKETDGKWTFIPDEDYKGLEGTEHDGIMNFGKDSYAAMTWYINDFGTAQNPVLPDILEINWANTWDYCRIVAKEAGQKFNATYNLILKAGLKNKDGKYVLTQTPIEEYKELRNTENAVKLENITVTPDNSLLKDFKGDCYEIVSKFAPEDNTKKIGFKIRTGNGQETAIIYDLETETLSIDRSKSGVIINGAFAGIDSQKVTKNNDGTIDLHIYVDRGLVEVFAKDYTVAGANQVFPSISSLGASVFAEGGNAKADITIYPMNNIWKEKAAITEDTKPLSIASSSAEENKINIGDSINLNAYLLPIGVSQDIEWSVDNSSIVSINKDTADMANADIKALKAGTVVVSAISKADPSLKKVQKLLSII
ncbi:MAG: GH32 C-terminal domain-containing protein [Lachnospiraceae bacterium]